MSFKLVKSVAKKTASRATLGALALSMGACGFIDLGFIGLGSNNRQEVVTGDIAGFVLADEPRAAMAAAEVLTEGGSAADAATALYFTLSVTYPTASGLGAGGSCVYWDNRAGSAFGIEFPSANGTAGRAPAYAVPGAVAGFGKLHEMYGVLPWARDLVRAELLARDGFVASRATAKAIEGLPPTIRGNRNLVSLLRSESGGAVTESSRLRNVALADVLAELRVKGAADMYTGGLAMRLAKASGNIGGGPSREQLAAYQPRFGPAASIAVLGGVVRLPGTLVTGSQIAANILTDTNVLADAQGLSPAGRAEVMRIVERRERQTLGLSAQGKQGRDARSTSFAVIDRAGDVVSCGVSLNGPVGSGVMVPRMGFVFANPADSMEAREAQAGLAPAIVTRKGRFRGVITASSGYGAPAALATLVMSDVIKGDASPLPTIRQASVPSNGYGSAIYCGGGRISQAGVCVGMASPASFGLMHKARYD